MNEPDLSFIKSDINISQVAPLNRRRLVAFVNCYLLKMLDFLNTFVTRAETAILEADQRLRSADAKLKILEAKLAMVPDPSSDILELQADVKEVRCHSPEAAAVENEVLRECKEPAPDVTLRAQAALSEASEEAVPSIKNKSGSHEPTKSVVLVKDDPAFTKYFRMLKLGVVEAAVKLKMQSEGVDPSLLDQPYAPSPNTANTPPLSLNSDVRRGHSESSSVSSFCDSD